jgi:hypothetical protein
MTPDEIKAYVDEHLEAKMSAIADLAVKKALDQIYKEVGKSVLRRAAAVIGIALFALFMYLAGSGHIKP